MGRKLSVTSAFIPQLYMLMNYFFFAAFAFEATARLGPFRVRAFVRVRCPRTGKPLRCRNPR